MANDKAIDCKNCGRKPGQHLGEDRKCPGQSTYYPPTKKEFNGWKALERHENVLGLGLVSSYVVVDNENYNVCSVDVADEYGEQERRAKLIAAAPELLEALKRLVELSCFEDEGLVSGMPTAKEWRDAYVNADTAIAKAEGRL